MSGIVQEYFATLSDRILTTALQDTLVCSQDDNSTSSQPSVKQQVTSTAPCPVASCQSRQHSSQPTACTCTCICLPCFSQREKKSKKQRSRNEKLSTSSRSQSQDSPSLKPSPNTPRRSSDTNWRGSDFSRRDSDTSRRGSDASRRGSDASRRSSASTSGSRRSSGAHGSNSSDGCPEIEEYFATYQVRTQFARKCRTGACVLCTHYALVYASVRARAILTIAN